MFTTVEIIRGCYLTYNLSVCRSLYYLHSGKYVVLCLISLFAHTEIRLYRCAVQRTGEPLPSQTTSLITSCSDSWFRLAAEHLTQQYNFIGIIICVKLINYGPQSHIRTPKPLIT